MQEGHMMSNCPLLKTKSNKFKQKKAVCATRDKESGSEEDLDNVEAMLCCMSIKEKKDEVEENNTSNTSFWSLNNYMKKQIRP